MEAYKCLHLIGEFNAALDTGRYDKITVDEVKRHASAGTIPAFVVDRLGDGMDLSIIDRDDWAALAEEWQGFADTVDERRKMGIVNRGVCLLLAYTLGSHRQRQ